MTDCGSTDTARDGPPVPLTHLSYSSLTNYLKCGKAYQLSKILGLPEQAAWWSIGGRAVHEATEIIDRNRYKETGK